ncbi:hypothetical protein ACFL0T_03015 [Candidatus Omnitrophota bacterium]
MGKHKKRREKVEYQPAEESRSVNIDKYLDIGLIILLFMVVFLMNLPLSKLEFMQPDGSGYLDMGRNLFTGKGAVISYNINQYWPGKYYPFLPYMQPVYGIVAGLVWMLFGLQGVITFNMLTLAGNSVLLYKIVRLYSDSFTSFLIGLFIGLSHVLIFPAISPLTEQLNLFFLLLALFVYLRYEKAAVWTGLILAVSCLTRIASFYNVAAFILSILIIKRFSKEALKELMRFLLGFLAVFLTYEIFCFLRYGVFYPEYLKAAKIYKSAEIYPGAFYKDAIPTLNMPDIKVGSEGVFANIWVSLTGFFEIFDMLKFVYILAPGYLIYDFIKKRRTPILVLLFLNGFAVIGGYTLAHTWSKIYEFSRFSVIPFTMLGALGFLSLKAIFSGLMDQRWEKRFPAIFIIIMLVFLGFHIRSHRRFTSFYLNVYPTKFESYTQSRDMIYEWIRDNSQEDDLIASAFLRDAFFMERPIVSLPRDEALTEKNLRDYLEIYKPKYVLAHDPKVVDILVKIGFKLRIRSGNLFLFGQDGN